MTAKMFTPLPDITLRSTQTAQGIGDEFAAYFVYENGKVPWQQDDQNFFKIKNKSILFLLFNSWMPTYISTFSSIYLLK